MVGDRAETWWIRTLGPNLEFGLGFSVKPKNTLYRGNNWNVDNVAQQQEDKITINDGTKLKSLAPLVKFDEYPDSKNPTSAPYIY